MRLPPVPRCWWVLMAPLAPQMCPQGPWAALLLLVGVLASDTPPSARGRKKVVHVLGECWGGPWWGSGCPSVAFGEWGLTFMEAQWGCPVACKAPQKGESSPKAAPARP